MPRMAGPDPSPRLRRRLAEFPQNNTVMAIIMMMTRDISGRGPGGGWSHRCVLTSKCIEGPPRNVYRLLYANQTSMKRFYKTQTPSPPEYSLLERLHCEFGQTHPP